MEVDYYKILGLHRDATSDQIRRAYRSKAKLYHPDINNTPNAKLLFQLVNEAYQILTNPDKRKWYDFKLKYPSTTGARQPDRHRTSTYASYYKAYTYQQQQKQEEKESANYKKTLLDNILFYFLVFAGAMAIIFSALDMISEKVNMKTASGLVFGVWFLLLMFWGWNLLSKK